MKKSWNYGHWEKGHYISVGKRGYWSKYGGGKERKIEEEYNWFCQTCKREQLSILPSYKIPLDDLGIENARVCTLCKYASLLHDVFLLHELLKLVRPFGNIGSDIANLLTLPLPY